MRIIKVYFLIQLLCVLPFFSHAQCTGNCQTGKGVFKYTSGETYDGYWLNGKRSGKGTMLWNNGEKYVGFWKNDFQHGFGEMNFSDGRKFEGEWAEGRQNGAGKMFKNGNILQEGTWNNGNFIGGNSISPAPQNIVPDKNEHSVTSNASPKREKYKKLTIFGKPDFIAQISNALRLLEEKSPEEAAIVFDYVVEIKQHDKSGMRVEKKTIELADRTTFHSVQWCASVLVHEAYHSKIYTEYQKKHPASVVPYEVYGGEKAEKACNLLQAKVGEKIGLGKDDIEYLLKGDGKHGDIDGDGDVDENDYKLRDW
jgi:hypothetical protein